MTELQRPAYVHDLDIEITQNEDWTWPLQGRNDDDDIIDTTDYTATMTIRAPDPSGDVLLTVDDTGGGIVLGFDPPIWEAATVYGVGQQVVPTTLNGYVYEVTVAGTSHASTEPTWPTTIGNTVVDNTVTWRAEEVDTDVVANVSVQLSAAETAALTAWGRGTYSLSVKNEFGQSWLYVDGAAYLRESNVS
jgi:hypothetical protein